MTERRSSRARVSLRGSLNENALTLEASMHDEDAEAEYRVVQEPAPAAAAGRGKGKGRGRGRPRKSEGERKEAEVEEEEEEKVEDVEEEEQAEQAGRGRKRRGGRKGASGDDSSELTNPIYQKLAHSKTIVSALAKEIIHQYGNEKRKRKAIVAIINCMFNACACTHVLDESDLDEDATSIVRDASDPDHQSTLDAPINRIKTFGPRWNEFWSSLIKEAESSKALYDETLIEEWLSPWLKALSSSVVRVWRRTATAAAFSIVHTLNQYMKEMQERMEVLEKQLESKTLKKGKSHGLDEQLAELQERYDVIVKQVQDLHAGVFVHRFRDVDESIRHFCAESKRSWLKSLPAFWVQNEYIKYVGWLLNDKDQDVRREALYTILDLFESGNEDVINKADAFLNRFQKRIQEMCNDVDADVASVAAAVSMNMLKLGRLDETEGEDIPSLLWDSSPALRESAAQFVMADTFDTEEGQESSHEEDINQLLVLFNNYYLNGASKAKRKAADSDPRTLHVLEGKLAYGSDTSLQRPMDQLVNAFWMKLPALHDYAAISKAIFATIGKTGKKKTNTPAVDEKAQLLQLHLLGSVCKRATGHMDDPSIPSLSNVRKKDEREVLERQRSTFSEHFVSIAADLLSPFQLDATKSSIILDMIPRVDLTPFSTLRKKKEYAHLLKLLKSIYTKQSDQQVLERVVAAMRHLSHTDHPGSDEAQQMVEELAAEVGQTFSNAYEQIHGTAVDMEQSEEGREISFLTSLKRLLCLQRSISLPSLSWSSLPALHKSLQFYAVSHHTEMEQQLLALLLHAGFTSLQWNLLTLDQQAKREAEEAAEEAEEEKEEAEGEEEEQTGKGRGRGKRKKKKGEDEEEEAEEEEKKSAPKGRRKSGKRVEYVNLGLLNSTRNQLHSYISQLGLVFDFTGSANHMVRDVAFSILTDTFILFNGKLGGSRLDALAIGHDRLPLLQSVYNTHFIVLIDGSDIAARTSGMQMNRERREALASDLRIKACRDAIKVAAYDMNARHIKDELGSTLRHRELAGQLLVRYGRYEELDPMLKRFQAILKGVSTNTLLQAQLEALKIGWRQSEEKDEEAIKALAQRFVLTHNIRPDSRSFVPMFRYGMVFALARPYTNLKFLHALIPFVQRASIDDMKECARAFSTYGSKSLELAPPVEDRDEEDFGSLQIFADAINKKFQRQIMDVTPDAVLIGGRAGPPATPSIAATPIRRPHAEGEEKYMETLTPMAASPAGGRASGRGSAGVAGAVLATPPSARSAGARLSRASAAGSEALATVSEDEAEMAMAAAATGAGRRGRRSTGGRKRRQEFEGEEGEEEEAQMEEEEEPTANGRVHAMEEEFEEEEMETRTRRRGGRGRKRGAEE